MLRKVKTFIGIWGAVFALSVFLILMIADHVSGVIWASLVFDGIAFISQLFLWLKIAKERQNAEEIFRNAPVFFISCAYILIETAFCVVCSAVQDLFSLKTALMIHVVVMAAAWIIISALLSTKGHIRRVDSRQTDHHIKL